MNQDQRKFLLARVEQTYRSEIAQLDSDKLKEPSLNNYLVAACLDGTVQLRTVEEIKDSIRKKVLSMGHSDSLINSNRGYGSDNRANKVELYAEELFILPRAYLDALAEYNKAYAEIEKKKKILYAQKESLLLKIQIGSNQVLDRLVTDVDNMIDISLMNNRLMLKE